MGETTKKRLSWLLGITLGTAGGLSVPHIATAVENWLGNLMLQAIHQHWQWEQAQESQSIIELLPNTSGTKM